MLNTKQAAITNYPLARTFRKTCRFSKKLFNHFKAFELAFFYINHGFI
jgi:hypothetical protein